MVNRYQKYDYPYTIEKSEVYQNLALNSQYAFQCHADPLKGKHLSMFQPPISVKHGRYTEA